MTRATVVRWAAAALALFLPIAVQAQQDYPTKPITLVVGFAAGGFADSVARVVGGKLGERLGQNVIIENRGGAGGNIAAAAVAKAAPDGHTLLVTTTGMAVNETLSKKKGFVAADLKAIAIPATAPETLSVHPSNPVKTLAELIETARSKPINYGSPGVGTVGHVAGGYFFTVMAKVGAVHVPFQGGAPALNAAVGGHIDVLVGALPGYASQLQSGAIRSLAVASEQRLPLLPTIPTYAEQGFPGFLPATWVGFFAPAKTSDAIVVKLNKAIDEVIREPDVQERFKALHMQARYQSQPDAAAYFSSEVETWAKMLTAVGLKSD
jgi:tripartite-type tricarboxylate transporter receptor subunit TctC